MTAPALPNRELILALYRRYYVEGDADRGPEVSSHWVAYHEGSDVRIDDQGEIAALQGAGFGAMAPVPCIYYLDGPVRHRLSVLVTNGSGRAEPRPALSVQP